MPLSPAAERLLRQISLAVIIVLAEERAPECFTVRDLAYAERLAHAVLCRVYTIYDPDDP